MSEFGHEADSRFLSYVAPPDENGCRLWTRSVTKAGYGQFVIRHGVHRYAHRYAWEMKYGPLPAGAELDHWRMNEVTTADEKLTCSLRCTEHVVLVSHRRNLHESPKMRKYWNRNRERKS